MSAQGPKLERRRANDFERELLERARTWIPPWGLQDGERDFGRALLQIAARFSGVVAERLDRAGEKMSRGFLDWLAIGGKAAIPARLPVVFKLADKASAVSATAPVKLQVDVRGTPIVLESETDVRLIPAHIEVVVGADPGNDAYYLPPPGLSSLDPQEPLPTQWEVKSFAAPSSTTLQLDPALGLTAGTVLEIEAHQYRIVSAKGDLVTIEPAVPLEGGFEPKTLVKKVASFAPFDATAHNWQQHVLYLGDKNLLKLDASAYIDVVGAQSLPSGTIWEYWGKNENPDVDKDKITWWPLEPGPNALATDAVVTTKPAGSMEILKLGDVESRWIRARISHIEACAPALSTDELSLRINAQIPTTINVAPPSLALEAFVNASPSPTTDFDPLGRNPRLFDTFYLGCAEAFSKVNATVAVKFDLADTSFQAFATLNAGPTGALLAGVDKAGALHLQQINTNGTLTPLSGRGPLLPPGATAGTGIAPQGKFRPLTWSSGADFYVVIAVGRDVWAWHEHGGAPTQSSFEPLGRPDPNDQSNSPVQGLASINVGGALEVVALRGGRLFVRSLQPGAPWTSLPVTSTGGGPVDVAMVTSIRSEGTQASTLFDAVVCVGNDKKLYRVNAAGTKEVLNSVDVETDVEPYAAEFLPTGTFHLVAATANNAKLVAYAVPPSGGWFSPPPPNSTVNYVPLEAGDVITDTLLDARVDALGLTVYGIAKSSAGLPYVLAWRPFDDGLKGVIFKSPMDLATGTPTGALTLVGDRAYMPGVSGEVLSATYSAVRQPLSANRDGFVSALTTPSPPAFAVGDIVAPISGQDLIAKVTAPPTTYGTASYSWLDQLIDVDMSDRTCFVFPTSLGAFSGTMVAPLKLTLDGADLPMPPSGLLLVGVPPAANVFSIVSVTAGTATLAPYVPGTVLPTTNPVPYWRGTSLTGKIVPALELDASNNDWNAAALASRALYFPTLAPTTQFATAVMLDSALPNAHVLRIALARRWSPPLPPAVASPISFAIEVMPVSWASLIGDTTSNPALSWEYWDGNGWTPLTLKGGDPTLNLKHSESITFEVPTDLRPTDWAGKTNHWIRARLIGGDYGQETPIVTSTTDGTTTTYRTERSSVGVQAPRALRVSVSYVLNTPTLPTYLITEDSGNRRDQSDANRTPDARIDIFTPLCATLAKLEGKGGSPPVTGLCLPDCDCGSTSTSASSARTTTPTPCDTSPPAPASASTGAGRALYLGFSATFTGEPINVLVVVEKERPYDTLAPLNVETLIGGRFEPVIAADKTRALGETGILSMVVPDAPGSADLFGNSLTWLRLSPGGTDSTLAWAPSIRGVYVNGVWARAAETMTRELVGSSEGAPNLMLTLARPPLLQGTLELRVREPLEEEQRALLRETDETKVLSAVENLPGDWVRWECVVDPGDYGPSDRVYSLDETTGTILFGDGLHGMIPPIGRDAIVAFTYQRTEPPLPEELPVAADSQSSVVAGSRTPAPVPANTIAPRASLGLVSPVEGVEAAFAADNAGGGATPESDDRVLRFAPARLWHRTRALTLQDFEELALESSSDIAQAKAFRRQGGIRLVVVMRGATPQPTRAAQRELRSALAASAPAFFAAPSALQIEGPAVRRLRIELVLQVASLDVSGSLATFAERAIRTFFDSSGGGLDANGWPLGETPQEDDIALALLEAPHLESIDHIDFTRIDDKGDATPWRGKVKANELVMLASDGVRVDFKIIETVP